MTLSSLYFRLCLVLNNAIFFSTCNYNDNLFPGYESVFDKKAFGGELEIAEVESFFKECDLFPSQAEIDEAIDVTMHGRGSNAFIFPFLLILIIHIIRFVKSHQGKRLLL